MVNCKRFSKSPPPRFPVFAFSSSRSPANVRALQPVKVGNLSACAASDLAAVPISGQTCRPWCACSSARPAVPQPCAPRRPRSRLSASLCRLWRSRRPSGSLPVPTVRRVPMRRAVRRAVRPVPCALCRVRLHRARTSAPITEGQPVPASDLRATSRQPVKVRNLAAASVKIIFASYGFSKRRSLHNRPYAAFLKIYNLQNRFIGKDTSPCNGGNLPA